MPEHKSTPTPVDPLALARRPDRHGRVLLAAPGADPIEERGSGGAWIEASTEALVDVHEHE